MLSQWTVIALVVLSDLLRPVPIFISLPYQVVVLLSFPPLFDSVSFIAFLHQPCHVLVLSFITVTAPHFFLFALSWVLGFDGLLRILRVIQRSLSWRCSCASLKAV